MVDSILDNHSLRTQRRGDLKLEISLQTSSAETEQLVAGMKEITERKDVESAEVYLSEITGKAIIIVAEYYTAPLSVQEFNAIKQDVNLRSLKLMEKLKIEIAGASTDIRLNQQP
jgi:MscS family membrane protein